MIKRTLNIKDEIDLIEITKSFWDKKNLVISIILISLLLGVGYNYKKNQEPTIFKISLNLAKSDKSEFLKYIGINKVLEINNLQEFKITNESIIEKFIDKLLDYETILLALKNNTYIKKKISKLSPIDQEKKILNYAKSLKIQQGANKYEYNVSFIWNNSEEGVKILSEFFDFILLDLYKKIYSDLDNISSIIKKLNSEENSKKIDLLLYKRAVSKELSVIEKIEPDKFYKKTPNEKLTYNLLIKSYGIDFKKIDKEISLLQKRKDRDIIFLNKEIDLVKKDSPNNWISYNVLKVSLKLLNPTNNNKILIISLIFGLILSVICILILAAFQTQTREHNSN
jgi:hypothetical protein